MPLLPVILSGGSGTRLWPLSRQLMPKQFLPLAGKQTMFQTTLQRLHGIPGLELPVVVCNEEHRFIVAEQLREIGMGHQGILLEPAARNTAPAIAVAAMHAQRVSGADPILLVLPADHVIQDVPALHQAIGIARQQAEQGALVTFGIVPTEAHTGYGYIRAGHPVAGASVALTVAAFVEKPDLGTAERYVASGEYFWNSGMFMFRASRFLEELGRFRPDILAACEVVIEGATTDIDFVRLDGPAFAQCPEDSIDYAVMEKTDQAVVVPLDAAWSDVGSWSALWEVRPKEEAGNVRHGDVLAHGAQDCYLHAESRLVAAVGVQDLVVVETKDAVLVAHKSQVQDVKHVVAALKAAGRPEYQNHREVYRPWGAYDSVDHGARHQVKRITVKPGARLSLQMHHHRAEHWIVVRGTARVTCGDKTYLVTENQSTYIPVGEVHCLENPGVIPLEMIEVQSGSYLGEDDIVRLEDRYGRV